LCTPWNFPADEIMLLAIPALIAGNAIIVKPSEVTPLTGQMVLGAFTSVLPEGVATLIQGDGSIGAPLVQNPDVSMVAMTGSSATGKKILESCSHSLKRVVLELGGKDPMVVFSDADLDKAAEDAVTYSLFNCGQVCCSIERVYVDESVKSAFEEKVVAAAKSWQAGNGLEATSKIGPMVSSMQRDVVQRHVEEAVSSGAKVLHRGEVPEATGNFYPATVVSSVTQEMTIQHEETFGPIVCISSFNGCEEEAVRLSNESQFGLTACVYSNDIAKAKRVSRLIKAGQVGINNYPMMTADPSCPWAGHKGSGFGYHSGPDGWRQFSMPQSIILTEPAEEKC